MGWGARRQFIAWRMVGLALSLSAPSYGHGLLKSCAEILRIWVQAPSITEARIKEFLPQFHRTYRDYWAKGIDLPPEAASGLTTEQAIALLHTLKGRTGLTWGATKYTNPAWGNTTYFLNVNGAKVILKTNQQRTSTEGDRVVTFTNNVRYEVLAFALDRYLGTNLVPPAVMLDSGRVAVLFTPGQPTNFSHFVASPGNLVHATHIRFIDALVSNGDRDAPGNLVISSKGKPVAIDFDLSRPYYRYFGFNSGMEHVSKSVLIDPSRRFGKSGPMPGVVSRQVMEKLEKLDEATLLTVASEAGLILTKDEIANVLGSVHYLRYTVGEWVKRYGEASILVHPRLP